MNQDYQISSTSSQVISALFSLFTTILVLWLVFIIASDYYVCDQLVVQHNATAVAGASHSH